jgi:hypothetical protein
MLTLMNITEDVRKRAVEQRMSEVEGFKRGTEKNSNEFAEMGVEVYAIA